MEAAAADAALACSVSREIICGMGTGCGGGGVGTAIFCSPLDVYCLLSSATAAVPTVPDAVLAPL